MFSTINIQTNKLLRECRLFSYIPLMVFVALYIAVVFVIAKNHGLDGSVNIGMYSPLASLFLLLIFIVWILRFFHQVLLGAIRQAGEPLTILRKSFLQTVKLCTLVEMVLPMVILSLFNAANTAFKVFIGIINPFHLDPLLAKLDRALHGGIDTWQITHSLLPTATGTFTVDLFYTGWLLVMWSFLYWQVLRVSENRQRHQFFLAYVLCWALLGSLLAYLLSSAGPCYYGLLYSSPDLFEPLMERLHSQREEIVALADWRDIMALNGQSYLWNGYTAATMQIAGGISAAPSLHISMTVLFVLSAWKVNRVFGWIMIAYAAIIMFGSVHLGWHYAIDGYIAIVLTLLIWFLSGWLLERWDRFMHTRLHVQIAEK